jgi:thiamine-phosphate pyrophosphorylase
VSALDLPRLYPILDLDALAARRLAPLAVLDAWLDAGVRLWQLRAKTTPSGPLLELLDQAVARTHGVGGRLIVNDRFDLALMAGADGVHLGQTDLSPAAVRAVAAAPFVVGRSTHTDDQVRAGCAEPVSYLAIGPVFPTASKGGTPDPPVGLAGVRRAADEARRAGVPVVAIGGITLDRAAAVLQAGAASVAVIADLLTGDPGRRLGEYDRTLRALTL